MNLVTPCSSRLIAASISFSIMVMVMLSACGGGGSSPPPAPVPISVTCPNGTTQTAATTDLANAACPLPQLASVSPTIANAAVSADSFASVDVVTDSTLDATSITTTNVTLKAGTTAVAGAASAVGTKSLKFVPTAKLNYAQAYSFSAMVKDTLGKVLTVNSTFTTAAVDCAAPQVSAPDGQTCVVVPVCPSSGQLNSVNVCMQPPASTGYTWDNITKAWDADIGTLVVGLNTLPAECVTVGDACWKASSASGLIKYFASNTVINGRKNKWAGIIIGGNGVGSGSFRLIPIYSDTEADTPITNKALTVSFTSGGIVNAKGSQDGVRYTTPTSGCWEIIFDGSGVGSRSVSCPI